MTPSFQDEVQLAGWSETHNGGAKVTFWLPSNEALDVFRTLTARKGQTAGHRFACVLVEIGDDETPVQQEPKPETPPRERMGDLCYWSVMRCAEPTFWEFLNTTFPSADTVEDADEAGELLKFVCTVDSRREFDADSVTEARFKKVILHPYHKWAIAKGLA